MVLTNDEMVVKAESNCNVQGYTIVLSQWDMGLIFAHRLLTVFDSNKRFVAELDGPCSQQKREDKTYRLSSI